MHIFASQQLMCNSQLHETIIRRGGSPYFASNERTQNISYAWISYNDQLESVSQRRRTTRERDPLLHRPPVDGVCLGINISGGGGGFALYEVSTCKRTTASLHRRRRRYCLVWLHHVVVVGDYLTPSKFANQSISLMWHIHHHALVNIRPHVKWYLLDCAHLLLLSTVDCLSLSVVLWSYLRAGNCPPFHSPFRVPRNPLINPLPCSRESINEPQTMNPVWWQCGIE